MKEAKQKCEICEYAKTINQILKKQYEEKYQERKATIIVKTVTIVMLLQIAVINTILLFNK